MKKDITIINNKEISAIYYGLLLSGYDFHSYEKDPNLVKKIDSYRNECDSDTAFFANARQKTCEIYPYWPRVFTLEKATFHLCNKSYQYKDFDLFKKAIKDSANISDAEKNEAFWSWVKDFPIALNAIKNNSGFNSYFEWENSWINQQKSLWKRDLEYLQQVIEICNEYDNSPIDSVVIILNPIKCTNSADYFRNGNMLYFVLGAFRKDAIIHEYLHQSVHYFISNYTHILFNYEITFPGIDVSYYLDGDMNGKLNAFEEYIVRKLTDEALNMNFPLDLNKYILNVLQEF